LWAGLPIIGYLFRRTNVSVTIAGIAVLHYSTHHPLDDEGKGRRSGAAGKKSGGKLKSREARKSPSIFFMAAEHNEKTEKALLGRPGWQGNWTGLLVTHPGELVLT